MKKAFITGATGFIGLNLIELLLQDQWEVTALHLPGEDLTYLSRYQVSLAPGNILDYPSLQAALSEDHDVVFHLAGDTTTWKKHADRQFDINVNGTINMCKAAHEKKVSRFVLTSSSSAYGIHKERLSESIVSNALETGISYHKTKYLSEVELKKFVDNGLDAVIVNPCNLIGPYDVRNWSQLIINVCKGKMPGYPPGGGTFAHVRDIAKAHMAAAEKGKTGENYLLGGIEAPFKAVIDDILRITGSPLSLKPISKTKLRLAMGLSSVQAAFSGKEPLLTYPKYRRLVETLRCDSSKAKQALGFSTTPIPVMITDCYQWLKAENFV